MILERKTANLDLEDEEGPGSYYGDDSLNLVSFDVSKEPAVKSPSQIDNKKNPLPLLSEGIPELEEEGEDVLAIYSNSLRERGWIRGIGVANDLYRDCHDPNKILEEIWANLKARPKRYVGGRHLSWLSKLDYPLRVSPLPRPIWIELGQRLDYNYIQSQFELEFRDYVEEVEELERELQGVEQLSDPCKRRVAESKVRQATISRIEDIGLIEEITRSKGFDLIPLAEDRVANNRLHNITERAWLTYSADGLVPFLYSNSYIEGGRRLIFKHQDPRELWEQERLFQLDPLNFEDLNREEAHLPLVVTNNINQQTKKTIHLTKMALDRVVDSRRTRLTQDELLLFGFDLNNRYLPDLELFETNHVNPFNPKLQELSQHEFEIWKINEIFLIPSDD